MPKVLCILSEILGNKTFSSRVHASLKKIPGVEVSVITFSSEDYRRYPSPTLSRLSDTFEAMSVFSRKLDAEPLPEHDMVIVNGLWLAMVLVPRLSHRRVAVATDTTPKLIRAQSLELSNSIARRVMLYASGAIQDRQVREIVPSVGMFLPRSSWCGQSLAEDYNVDPSKIRVTLSPQPAAKGRASRAVGSPLRLLFVGNDFFRKGGARLLEAFETVKLAKDCTLTIVSNDASLTDISLPDGAKHISGLRSAEQVAPQYLCHDLLLYPSKFDQFSHVVAEASMAGVPSIASDIGGVSDLIEHGKSGLLMSQGATSGEWSAAILELAKDEQTRAQFAENAYRFGQERLLATHFDELIRGTLKTLM